MRRPWPYGWNDPPTARETKPQTPANPGVPGKKIPTDKGRDLVTWWWITEPNPRPSMRFFRKALILRVLASIKWPFCIAKNLDWVGVALR